MQSPDTHLVFSATIDALFHKVLAQYLTATVEAKVKAAGIDLSRKLDPAYPMRVFDDAIEVVAAHGMPHLERHTALRRIGELQIEAYQQTLIGKATFQFVKLLSRERFLKRMTQSWRSANNFVEATVVAQDGDRLTVRVNDAGRLPEVIQGVLAAGFAAAGHRCEVNIGSREGLACDYLLTFKPR